MQRAEINTYLKQFISPERIEKMEAVVRMRNRYITVVLEDIFQAHNISAVLRSCDAFSIQDVHIIENHNHYRVNPKIELGTAQWLSIHRYHKKEENSQYVLEHLKQKGYRLIATVPSKGKDIHNIELSPGPLAILFGTELKGLSFSVPRNGR